MTGRGGIGMVRGKRGQTLIYVLVVMILGMLVVTPLLAYVSLSLKIGSRAELYADARSAAEAGIEAVIGDLLAGANALSDDEDVYPTASSQLVRVGADEFTLDFGDYTDADGNPVNVTIQHPTAENMAPVPSESAYYLDPGVAFGLNPMKASNNPDYEDWDFEVVLVEGNALTVNWARGTRDGSGEEHTRGEVSLYREGEEDPIATSTSVRGQDCNCMLGEVECLFWHDWARLTLDVSGDLIEGGDYIVRFHNDSFVSADTPAESKSNPFNSAGGDDYTWVLVGTEYDGQILTYQDYIVTCVAKDTNGKTLATITTYLRQTPGPSVWWEEQTVQILSWVID